MHDTPVVKDLVLVGGGHSHVAVLRAFGMKPLPGLRITLVSRGTDTPYSGMLPGLIGGHYSEDEVHIDLVPLCRFAGARFIEAEVCGLDLEKNNVLFAERPPLEFDLLSINSGSTPAIGDIVHRGGDMIRVKPIDRFLHQWRGLQDRVESSREPLRIGVIGGGAGGVELVLAIERRLSSSEKPISFHLFTDEDRILSSHADGVRRRFERLLSERDIVLGLRSRIVERNADGVVTESGESIRLDEVLFVTHAAAAPWIAQSGLAVDERGFVLVDEYLRSHSHANIFAAGDIAAMSANPRPKSGVFAVRQGKPLARNLRRAILRQPLRAYRPQRRFLSLIGTGGNSAVASRGIIAAQGRWVWDIKQRIDRRFMQRYQILPEMKQPAQAQSLPRVLERELPEEPHGDEMRCGGCGAKVGADALSASLRGLQVHSRSDVVIGLDEPDDAAVVSVPDGQLCVLTVDAFRPLVDDPYLFGRIVANHCLNDLYAVGAEPQTAMAVATLPVWPERKLVSELRHMLSGVVAVLETVGAELVGGHTSEGSEPSLGLSLTGLIAGDAVLKKRGLNDGDRLILTKPLGTGTLFAANMRGHAKGRWVSGAIASMLQSNFDASRCLREHGAVACTDVTGFGLAGHLGEMLGLDDVRVFIDTDALPALDGVAECLAAGWVSTLHAKNVAAASSLVDGDGSSLLDGLLFDPQTAGGLLAAVPAAEADTCIAALRQLGYARAAEIGYVRRAEPPGITLTGKRLQNDS